MKKTLVIYVLVLFAFSLGICGLLHLGTTWSVRAPGNTPLVASPTEPESGAPQPAAWLGLAENFKDPLARLLLQVVVIVVATRALGLAFVRFGLPLVIGEMTAGILLGPSLLGWLWPDAFGFVFPKESLGTLRLFSQIGVCVFMFVVGLELDVAHLRQKAHTAVVVSHASIMVPYLLGVAFSLLLYPSFASPGTSFVAFALFLGIAMSITAFPVLVRILEERDLARTSLGVTAITCAAVDDATAWAILAAVVAIVRATGMASILLNLGLVILFVAVMLCGLRPRLPRWLAVEHMSGEPTRGMVAGVLVFMALSALTTEVIGIHALFGAFLAGVVMPQRKEFREYLTVRLEDFSSIFLLPLFFAFSGLRTEVALLNDTASWLVCLSLIVVATAGKLGGTMGAARLAGMSWNGAFSLGALMNTRGLVELVALNIGYDLGILSPRIFAMMVLMALATTFMTGPLLHLAESARRRRDRTIGCA